MTAVHAPPGGVLVLQLERVNDLIERSPDLHDAIVECAAFVNWRRIQIDEPAVIALSFDKSVHLSDPPDRHGIG